MPTLEQNIEKWNSNYDWTKHGDEWSTAWGSTENLWNWMLFPRIKKFLNVPTILEIAPGYGRISDYLKNYCEELLLVDISSNCIEACKERFKNLDKIKYFVNDGKNLEMIKNNSVDFIISYDSLVHAEPDVHKSYIPEFERILKKNGKGFIHHSNLGSFNSFGKYMFSYEYPFKIKTHWRSRKFSAEVFRNLCSQARLNCYSQELINWGGAFLIDSFSCFQKQTSNHIPYNFFENYGFMKQAGFIKEISKLY